MSEYVTGEVGAISKKNLDNGGNAYSLKLLYPDGGEDWFGAGYDPITFGKGSLIEFQANYGDRFNDIVKNSIQVIEFVEPVQQGRGQGQGRQGGGQQRNNGNSSGYSGNSRGGNSSSGRSNQRQQGNSQGRNNSGGGQQGGQRQQQQRPPQRQQSQGQQRPQQGQRQQAAPDAGKSAYWDNKAALDLEKDKRISSFACVNTAIALADSMLLNKAITLGSKKDLKVDTYLSLVYKLADELEIRAAQKVDGSYGEHSAPTDVQDDGYQNSSEGGNEYDDDIPQ